MFIIILFVNLFIELRNLFHVSLYLAVPGVDLLNLYAANLISTSDFFHLQGLVNKDVFVQKLMARSVIHILQDYKTPGFKAADLQNILQNH